MTPEQIPISDTEKRYNNLLEQRYGHEATIRNAQECIAFIVAEMAKLEPIVTAEIAERNRICTEELGVEATYTPPAEVDPALLE